MSFSSRTNSVSSFNSPSLALGSNCLQLLSTFSLCVSVCVIVSASRFSMYQYKDSLVSSSGRSVSAASHHSPAHESRLPSFSPDRSIASRNSAAFAGFADAVEFRYHSGGSREELSLRLVKSATASRLSSVARTRVHREQQANALSFRGCIRKLSSQGVRDCHESSRSLAAYRQ